MIFDWEPGLVPRETYLCPDLKIKYCGKKDECHVDWSTPGIMDGGISVSASFYKDGYIHVILTQNGFISWDLDEIRFKPEINKEYTIYMKEKYPGRIYVGAHYERVGGHYKWVLDQEKLWKTLGKTEPKGFTEDLVPRQTLRIVRRANPQTVHNSIFKEPFGEESSSWRKIGD